MYPYVRHIYAYSTQCKIMEMKNYKIVFKVLVGN